jgi:hypothetical protein
MNSPADLTPGCVHTGPTGDGKGLTEALLPAGRHLSRTCTFIISFDHNKSCPETGNKHSEEFIRHIKSYKTDIKHFPIYSTYETAENIWASIRRMEKNT